MLFNDSDVESSKLMQSHSITRYDTSSVANGSEESKVSEDHIERISRIVENTRLSIKVELKLYIYGWVKDVRILRLIQVSTSSINFELKKVTSTYI